MAGFDFPNNPLVGDVFTDPASGATFKWNGYGWDGGFGGGGGAILVGPTPPSTPPDSSLWWESDTGFMFFRYNDGNSTQWVQVNAQSQPDLSLVVKKAGDTMTGNLAITPASGSPSLILNKSAANQVCSITAQTAGSNRWNLLLGDASGEGGSNAGSNFYLQRFDDSGAAIDSPLQIVRATAAAYMSGGLTITKPYNAAGDEALTITPSGGTLGNAAINLSKATASGGACAIQGRTAGSLRWTLVPGNGTAESGSNVGSDFVLTRYSDAGALIDSPLTITRSNGVITTTASIQAGGIIVATNGSFQARSAGNPAYYVADATGATNKGAFFWNNPDASTRVLNLISGGYLTLTSNVIAQPAAGGNFICNSGLGFQNGGGPWTALSDARIKDVQSDYTLGLAEVLALRPVVYTYKGNDKLENHDDAVSMHKQAAEQGKAFVGLVAQEAELILPGMVGKMEGWIDGEPVTDLRSLNTNELIYALVNAVKELSAKNTALEARIATLETMP